MRFGIKTLDEAQVEGKTVLCRVDINQPVDREKEHQPSHRLRPHRQGACGQGREGGSSGPPGQ